MIKKNIDFCKYFFLFTKKNEIGVFFHTYQLNLYTKNPPYPMSQIKYNAVMLIDDNEIDNLINQRVIENAGVCNHIFTHTGGKSAIEFLKNAEKVAIGSNDKSLLPQVIFLDIDMPLMDGFQFLDEFDNLSENIKEHCKIVMLTSSISSKDIKRTKHYANVKEYINKPLSKESVRNLEV